jgi:hypothetical protein
MPTPTQNLKNIRLVITGDIREWMTKVKTLVSEGADIRVLDNYKGEGSIVKAYILSGVGTDRICEVSRFLFEQGVSPTPELFVDAVMQDASIANIVMKAANGSINVNTLDIYGESVHDWVLRNTIIGKYPVSIKYLISKGLRTSTNNISLDDIIRIKQRL